MSFIVRRAGLSSLPLGLVPVVVMDTETTGVNVTTDRVIEIAAIRIRNGVAQRESAFAEFVNPQAPIPAASTAIHSITDGHVAEAQPFKPVMMAFSRWCGNSVVLGYSIGFDLGILLAEHKRHGLRWSAPRSLDVRHLVRLVAPQLPDQSLDTVAGWLGIEIVNRHRALADAELTLQVFQKLLPMLRQKNVVTLAQAERACLSLDFEIGPETQAGWHNVVRQDRMMPAPVAEYARIDSYLYRHRVRDVMHAPPIVVDGTVQVKIALAEMMKKRVSSVFVRPIEKDGKLGILTERDILRGIDQNGPTILASPIQGLARFPLVSISQNEFAYRAITAMARGGFRHLGVTEREGALVGALSARDLLKQRSGGAELLGESIDQAQNPDELGRIWAGLTTVVRGLVSEDVDSPDIASVVSRELRALTARAGTLAAQQMAAEGKGEAPERYALFVLGSGGRSESLLAMDQDNAIIFAEGEPGDPADTWFADFGRRVSDMLNTAGVTYCKGGVMASQPEWRMNTVRWRATVSEWLTKSRPEDILNSDIFFDAMSVKGDWTLVEDLRSEAIAAAAKADNFLRAMGMRAGDFEQPVGWFGRFKLDEGRLDLKRAGLLPLFSGARVLALRHGITARSTPDRLAAVRDMGVEGAHHVDDLIEAHRIILGVILRQQLRDIEAGLTLGNKVAPKQLDSYHVQQMRWAIDQVPKVRDLLGLPTFG
jgi:DNA polymerase-3 subunit epsilon/CBS domain-containing protein